VTVQRGQTHTEQLPSIARSSPRGTLNNAGWNGFMTIWNIAISFVVTPVLIYYLGAADYGLLVLVWSVTGVLAVTNLGVGEATLRYVSHYVANDDMSSVNRVFGSTLAFYMLICLSVSAVLMPATSMVVGWIDMPAEARHAAGWLLRLSAVLFSLGMIANAFRSIPMALQRYDIASKVGFVSGSVRTLGSVVIVVSGFGVLSVIIWEVVVAFMILTIQIAVARNLLPGLRWLPHMSILGMREIFGYGVYSFLTHIFLTMYRESGKLVLGAHAGPTGVAYLGAADGVAYRIYMVVVSGIETLMPRFSANRDPRVARVLVAQATEAALSVSVVLFIPLAVLMPDLLRLWISPEFARGGATVGQLMAVSFIGSAGFAPIATFYRGTGRPGFVTVVMALIGVAVTGFNFLLVPSAGATGVGYSYLLGAVGWLGGLLWGWFALFGVRPLAPLCRAVGVPLILAVVAFAVQSAIRTGVGEVNWIGLITLGGLFAMVTGAVLLVVDRLLGTDSLMRDLIERLSTSKQGGAFLRAIHLSQPR
jgi:O-antigen/teichoic acid export membrane protein